MVMHPGPMNRGVEIDSRLADDARSAIREQVEMGWQSASRCLRRWRGNCRTPRDGKRDDRRTALLNARLLDPATGLDQRGGLLIENGVIADLGRRSKPEASAMRRPSIAPATCWRRG